MQGNTQAVNPKQDSLCKRRELGRTQRVTGAFHAKVVAEHEREREREIFIYI